uniref:hypothetical protein n=1 Tax=Inquilinus sp. OTU3971 TaxID=3043855 RepID=UPI00313E0338
MAARRGLKRFLEMGMDRYDDALILGLLVRLLLCEGDRAGCFAVVAPPHLHDVALALAGIESKDERGPLHRPDRPALFVGRQLLLGPGVEGAGREERDFLRRIVRSPLQANRQLHQGTETLQQIVRGSRCLGFPGDDLLGVLVAHLGHEPVAVLFEEGVDDPAGLVTFVALRRAGERRSGGHDPT